MGGLPAKLRAAVTVSTLSDCETFCDCGERNTSREFSPDRVSCGGRTGATAAALWLPADAVPAPPTIPALERPPPPPGRIHWGVNARSCADTLLPLQPADRHQTDRRRYKALRSVGPFGLKKRTHCCHYNLQTQTSDGSPNIQSLPKCRL